MQDAAFGVHLREDQAASLGDAQAVAEHEEQKAPVPGLVPRSLGGGEELFDLVAGQVFSFVHCFAFRYNLRVGKGSGGLFPHFRFQ